MTKQQKKCGWLTAIVLGLVLTGASAAWADSAVTVPGGTVCPKDKFVLTQVFRNDGRIKGDLYVWAQTVAENGTVEGDLIGGGESMALLGDVLGNARIAGGSITFSGRVGKNVNAFAGTVTANKGSVIGGNLYAFAGELTLNGQVKGYTHLGGGKITLGGEFFGDVDINTDFPRECMEGDKRHEMKLTVLPGTIVHGRLKYCGSRVDIGKGAKIGHFEWTKPRINPGERFRKQVREGIWRFVRLIFTTAAFYLLGLVLFKRFPSRFKSAGDYSRDKIFTALGVGLLTLVSMAAAALIFLILLVMALFMSPAFGLIFGIVAFAAYLLIFFLAPLPVAISLGDRLFKGQPRPEYRFGLGLVVLNFSLFLLRVLAQIPMAGALFGLAAFAGGFAVLCIGSGAIVHGVFGKNESETLPSPE